MPESELIIFFKKKKSVPSFACVISDSALPSVRPLALERFLILPNLCLPSPIYRYVLPVLSPDVLSVAPSPVPPGPSWPLAVSQLHFHQIHGHQVSANMNISVGRPHPLTTGCRIILCAWLTCLLLPLSRLLSCNSPQAHSAPATKKNYSPKKPYSFTARWVHNYCFLSRRHPSSPLSDSLRFKTLIKHSLKS